MSGTAKRSGTAVDAVTILIAVVVALSFLFSFGNVWTLGIRLGVPVYVAPLVAPAVDLSVVGCLLGMRELAQRGAGTEQVRPVRRFLIFVSLVTLALNVTEPVIAGQYGKAAFDSVGCWLLIGWSHVGPRLLQAMNEAGRLDQAPSARRPRTAPGAAQPTTATDLGDHTEVPETTVPRQRRAARSPAAGPDPDEQLLARARAEDARHWELHRRPISAEELRKRLHVGTTRSRTLVSQLRADRAATGVHRVEAGAENGLVGAVAAS